MFGSLFLNILSVFILMLPGFILIRKKLIPQSSLKYLSLIVIKVFYPALIFNSITSKYDITEALQLWRLPVAVFCICIIGYLIGLITMGFFSNKSIERRKSILLSCTINNYSFLPLAIITILYSEREAAALILSTIGAELTLWTLGMFILKNEKGFKLSDLKNLLSMPLLSMYASLGLLGICKVLNIDYVSYANNHEVLKFLRHSLEQMGNAAIPLSLLMVGGRMGTIKVADINTRDTWMTTILRLVIIPLACVLFLKYTFAQNEYLNIMLIVAVMPTAINSQVLAEMYNADKKFIGGTILVTHMLSLITIPLWLMFLL